ncbi:MAG TPA: ATP-dependent helicase HrpB [Polyangiaceae bacterium]|jgi:ATP-dependent helicase HrpB|nr:ATP-dependent helicase HrpB [Polyangiaceae bacterium]
MQQLPIDALLPDIVASLRSRGTLVLEAPPGAGKTTRVPRALLDAGFAERGSIVVLEPRRLATRMAAMRVAEELGEAPGGVVGYQVRFEDVTGPATRVRFVTEGILGRRLVSAPDLDGVAVVILDEFHERHLQGDVALALLERLRRTTRPDLRVIAMSATLSTGPLAAYLSAPVLRAEGRRFEVAIDHLPSPDDRPLPLQVASALRSLLNDGLDGDVLVFLPGAAEIRRTREACQKLAADADLFVVPLHGDLSPQEQQTAVGPSARRKVILSTNVAESSVTIDGVVAVIDAGLARIASQSPWSGFPRLRVEKISRASATQRAGRAGRTRPGRCLRLYTRADHETRPESEVPEIRRLDLTQTWLELAAIGPENVPWFEVPPEANARAARDLLRRLGALENDKLSAIGRAMLRFAVHPRAARVVIEGERRGVAEEACIAAAILTEGDPRSSARARFGDERQDGRATEPSDLTALVDLFREAEDSRFSAGAVRAAGLDGGAVRAVARTVSQLARSARGGPGRPRGSATLSMSPDDAAVALRTALLAGYPDRVARRVRSGGRGLALAGGGSAELAPTSVVRDAEWMVALEVEERTGDAARSGAVVRLASAIEPEWLLDLFADDVIEDHEVSWDPQSQRVIARESMKWGNLTLHANASARPATAEAVRVLAEAALAAGPGAFAPRDALERWLARARFAASVDPSMPALDDDAVRATIRKLSEGRASFAELRDANLLEVLRHESGVRTADVDRLAPERVTLSGGRAVTVTYDPGRPPAVASRLQDFFGMRDGPKVAGGRVPLVLELNAPNGRAVQVTTDLAGFWERHYPSIRKELMRKYPRHAWPEDPTVPAPAMRPRRS